MQTVTQETKIDPVLQAHLYGGTVPASAMTGILPAYFKPGGTLAGVLDTSIYDGYSGSRSSGGSGSGSASTSDYADGGVVKYAIGGGVANPTIQYRTPNMQSGVPTTMQRGATDTMISSPTSAASTASTATGTGSGDGGILSLAEQVYQLTAGTDLGAQLPQYQVAGLTPAQQQAYAAAQQGVGSYLPYLQQGVQATNAGVGALTGGIQGTQQAVQGAQPYQQQAAGLAGMSAGATQGAVAGAQPYQTIGAGMTQQAAAGAAGAAQGYNPMAYQAFMNPYTEEVVRQTEQDVGRQAALLGNQIGASAVGAGAFGGSREAVARSEGARNLADQLARTTSQLRSQGYGAAQQQAQQAFEQQQQRQLGASGLTGQLGGQMANIGTQYGQLGLQGAGQLGTTSQILGNLGTSYGQLGLQGAGQMGQLGQGIGALGQQYAGFGQLGQQLGLQDINTLLSTGGQQQQYQQALLDAERLNRFQQVMAPYQQVGFRADVLSGSPTGTTTTMQQPGPSPLSQGIGLLTALGGLFG
jgi:hypothetical protein